MRIFRNEFNNLSSPSAKRRRRVVEGRTIHPVTILIPDAAFDDDHALERAAAAPFALLVRRAARPDEVPAAEWAAAEAIVAYHRMDYDAALAARLARCRILVRAGVGCDNVDLAALAARGIPVCNVPDYGIAEVADHALALMLALARGIVEFHRRIAADPVPGWDWRHFPPPVRRLAGARMLVVGFGRIGQAVARRAAAFDLAVGFHDPPGPAAPDGIRRYDTLEAGLVAADIVSLHAALTPETRGLINARSLGAMKEGAILINTARGGLVDLDALAAALYSGRLGGAGLDVLPQEPPDPAHPLIQALTQGAPWLRGRLILTPHAAFLSRDAITDMRRKAIETAVAYLRDGALVHCVNR
jgi:lactate dehydrogenase-like 2-hydroxyacid dehydrogenase